MGRVVVQAQIDSTQLGLINHKIIFAKLTSKVNPNDSIEVRMDKKVGNYQKLEDMIPAIVKHVGYIKVRKVGSNDCTLYMKVDIPLKIE